MISTIASITLFISVFIALFLITIKSKNRLGNRLFGLFLMLTAIDNAGVLYETTTTDLYGLSIFRTTFSFLQIPVFYLYVVAVCYADFELKPIHLLHLIPFLIVNLLLLPRFYAVDTADKISFLAQGKYMYEIQLNHALFHVQTITYLIAIFLVLHRTKKLYLENHSGNASKTYDWLVKFTMALCFIYAIALLKNIFKFIEYDHLSMWLKVGIHVLFLLLICWYLFNALRHSDLFKQVDSSLQLVSSITVEEKKQAKAPEEQKQEQQILLKLKSYMMSEKPFLNPSLTIQQVADAIDHPVRDLSFLLNSQLQQHFYDFVNTYRIEDAKNLLQDQDKNDHTVLEILYKVGFNSKSSFNTAFKKHTGTTPTSYRKHLKINVL